MADTTKLTASAYEKLQAEIERLEGEGRREIAARIKTAREWGDLKENAEYHAAKEEAAMLEARIEGLRSQVRSAEVVEAADGDVAGMGSTVTYTDEKTGREMSHKLVPKVEADPAGGLISIDSPVGEALAGSKVGDTPTFESPAGPRTMRVLAIDHS
ncbi:MAG: transcription elongation factor GreA [Thermoleophilaceae bacterium]